MNFGTNLLNWFTGNAQALVIVAIIVIGLYLAFKREFTKLLGFGIIAIIAVVLVFNPTGVKDLFLTFGNKILGLSSSSDTAGLTMLLVR